MTRSSLTRSLTRGGEISALCRGAGRGRCSGRFTKIRLGSSGSQTARVAQRRIRKRESILLAGRGLDVDTGSGGTDDAKRAAPLGGEYVAPRSAILIAGKTLEDQDAARRFGPQRARVHDHILIGDGTLPLVRDDEIVTHPLFGMGRRDQRVEPSSGSRQVQWTVHKKRDCDPD